MARLYNLAADPTERHDLAARDPRRVAEHGALIEEQNKGMAKPIWPGLVEGPVRIEVPMNAPWQEGQRSEKRRVGKEGVRRGRSRWVPINNKKTQKIQQTKKTFM